MLSCSKLAETRNWWNVSILVTVVREGPPAALSVSPVIGRSPAPSNLETGQPPLTSLPQTPLWGKITQRAAGGRLSDIT